MVGPWRNLASLRHCQQAYCSRKTIRLSNCHAFMSFHIFMVSEYVVGNLLSKHLPSSFLGFEMGNGVIKINKSHFIILYIKNTQIRQPFL